LIVKRRTEDQNKDQDEQDDLAEGKCYLEIECFLPLIIYKFILLSLCQPDHQRA